jgi:adenylate cyclase
VGSSADQRGVCQRELNVWRSLTAYGRTRVAAIAAGLIAAGLVCAAVVVWPVPWREAIHQRIIDTLFTAAASLHPSTAGEQRLVVVLIDERSLLAYGPWPWPRSRIAELVGTVSRAGAAAVAIDILFDGVDAKSPAALARRLGAEIDRPDIVAWAKNLPDGDDRLATAIAAVPVALGYALDPVGTKQVAGVPFLTRGKVDLSEMWRAPGGIAPPAALTRDAQGLGALALPGDADGIVRRVPLLVGVDDQLRPGFALEVMRLFERASAYLVDGGTGTLRVGDINIRLPPDGMLRLIPDHAVRAAVTRISAADLLMGKPVSPQLANAIVLIGGSAPELGGLRPASGDPLAPSVMLQAAAIDQLLRGQVPLPVPHTAALSATLALIATVAGLLSALLLRPMRGALAVCSFASLVAAASLAAAVADRIVNPMLPIVLAAASFVAAALVRAAQTHMREARLRQRFAQHLAPAVVELIAANPSVLKLHGERRQITALFTDVEDFTGMTRRAEPESLVALLDEYFEGVVQIVIDHGGMIDKLVGDGVHSLFNAPLELEDHAVKAVHCAIAIRAWSEAFRKTPGAQRLGLGRTRIGIETGDTIVGDVGTRTKLDYTAYGDAMNAAARLEGANKELGTAICIGPETASRCPPHLLRPTGTIQLRGFEEPVRTYTPDQAYPLETEGFGSISVPYQT